MRRWMMGVGAMAWTGVISCNGDAKADLPELSGRAATVEEQAEVDKYVGDYRFAGGQVEHDALLAAIDDTVADMNILARGIARGRLRDSNAVPKAISISRTGDDVAVAFDDRKYQAPLDGSSTTVVGITGDTLNYRVSVSAKQLEQTFVGPKGARSNTMRREGEELKMSVEIRSDRLPKVLRYQLTFRRA